MEVLLLITAPPQYSCSRAKLHPLNQPTSKLARAPRPATRLLSSHVLLHYQEIQSQDTSSRSHAPPTPSHLSTPPNSHRRTLHPPSPLQRLYPHHEPPSARHHPSLRLLSPHLLHNRQRHLTKHNHLSKPHRSLHTRKSNMELQIFRSAFGVRYS